MLLGGNNEIAESIRGLERTLNTLIEKQVKLYDRVERLETLEFEKAAKSDGCIKWLDWDSGVGASLVVDVPPNPYELGDYGWTHLKAWYSVYSTTAGNKTLNMIFNAVGANYGYTYKYARASAAPIVASADGQASYIIANLRGGNYTSGCIHVPFFPVPLDMHTWGDWTCRDTTQPAGSQVEKGEFGGTNTTLPGQRTVKITIFPSAGVMAGRIYLYSWCPPWDINNVGPPPD